MRRSVAPTSLSGTRGRVLADLYKDRGGAEALAVADSPAARQMLTHHYRQGTSTQTWTDEHKRLYVDELNGTLGGFPRAAGLRRVGVSSGRMGDALQDPQPGQRYVAGRLQVFSGSVPVSYRQENTFCTVSVDLNLPIVSSLVLEAFPLGLQANQKSLVARSNVETKVAGFDVDSQVSGLNSYINARVSITGLLGLCETFASSAKTAIVKQAVDAAVAARGKKEAAPYTATYEKSFEAYGDSDRAVRRRTWWSQQLHRPAARRAHAGRLLFGERRDRRRNTVRLVVASALNIATPTGRMDAAALKASSPFDQVYLESSSNLDHLSSTSGYFGKGRCSGCALQALGG